MSKALLVFGTQLEWCEGCFAKANYYFSYSKGWILANYPFLDILANQLEKDGKDHEEFGEDDAYVGPLQGCIQP